MHRPRSFLARTSLLVTAVLGGLSGPVAAQPPEPSAGIRWALVEGVLGNAVPMFRVDTSAPLAQGRFWALETVAQLEPTDDPRDDITWEEPAVWSSLTGTEWSREALPHEMLGRLSLVAWRDAPAIMELRYLEDPAGIDLRVWTRHGDAGWERVGRLRVRPTRSLRGCGFTNQQVAATREVIAITASCLEPFGAGGDALPVVWGVASISSAATLPRTDIPIYTWTTTDGRAWERHRVLSSPDEIHRTSISQFHGVGNGIAAVTYSEEPELLWSTDGARFDVIAALPGGELDWVHGIEAIVDGRGTPRTWLLLQDDPNRDPDDEPTQGVSPTLWRLDRGEDWSPALRLGASVASALAVEDDHVVVVSAVATSDVEETVRIETAISGDAATSFQRYPDSGQSRACGLALAVRTGTGVLACRLGQGQGLRWARLWTPWEE